MFLIYFGNLLKKKNTLLFHLCDSALYLWLHMDS